MRLPPEAAGDRSWFARKVSEVLGKKGFDESWFAREVSEGLGKKGFDEVTEAYWKWLGSLPWYQKT